MPKTQMQKTSLEAYFGEVVPNLNQKQKEVMDIFYGDMTMTFTNWEVADELEWSINRVTGRVYELRGKGKNNKLRYNPLLIESKVRMCRVTGRNAKAWQLNPDRNLRI